MDVTPLIALGAIVVLIVMTVWAARRRNPEARDARRRNRP